MYIEYLRFRVEPLLRDQFVQQDKAIWTVALSQNPGYHKKEVWLNPEDPGEIIAAIWWSDRGQWKAIPITELTALEAQFTQAMGAGTYELVEAREYHLADS